RIRPARETPMTLLGKVCVFFNVSLSLLMAAGALVWYFHGVDWSYDVNKPNEVAGLYKEKQEEIAEIQKPKEPAEGAWKAARPLLWKQEQERRDARAFYVKEMEHNRSKANKDDPAHAVVVERTKEGDFRAQRDKKNPILPVMQTAKSRVKDVKK